MEEIFKNYKWEIVGGFIGLVIALLLFTIGFFKTLLLIIFTIGGCFIGGYLYRTGAIDKLLKKIKN